MLRTLKAMARRRGEDHHAVEMPNWTNHDLRRVVRTGLSAAPRPAQRRRSRARTSSRPASSAPTTRTNIWTRSARRWRRGRSGSRPSSTRCLPRPPRSSSCRGGGDDQVPEFVEFRYSAEQWDNIAGCVILMRNRNDAHLIGRGGASLRDLIEIEAQMFCAQGSLNRHKAERQARIDKMIGLRDAARNLRDSIATEMGFLSGLDANMLDALDASIDKLTRKIDFMRLTSHLDPRTPRRTNEQCQQDVARTILERIACDLDRIRRQGNRGRSGAVFDVRF